MTLPGIALVLLLAQTPAPPAAPASIEGVVTKTGTGETLSKVTVTLTQIQAGTLSPGQLQSIGAISPTDPIAVLALAGLGVANANSTRQSMVTISDGKFRFENLKPGNYSLSATLGGYAPAQYGQRGPNGRGMNFSLKAGQKMQGASLTMTPEGTVMGRVVDANGDPVSRAMVEALKVVYQEKGRTLGTVQAVPTDDNGEYRLFWLPPGQYYFRAKPSDDQSKTIRVVLPSPNTSASSIPALTAASAIGPIGSTNPPIPGLVPGVKVIGRTLSNGDVFEEADVPVYYPSTPDASKASLIDVRPGDVIGGINITTATVRVYRIRGVIDKSNARSVSTTVGLIPRNGPTLSQQLPVLQDPNSTSFEIAGVIPGSYYLVTTGVDSNSKVFNGITPVDISASNVNTVIIATTLNTAINGRIAIEGAIPPLPGAPVRQTSVIVRLDPQTPGLSTSSAPMMADGTFTLNAVPGDYRVILAAPGMVPKSLLYEGKDAQAEGLHVGAGGGTLQIVLTTNAARLDGTVAADKQPVPNATVVLMPNAALRQQTNLYQSVQSNAEGHFTFENIPPGSYKVFAWDDIEDRAWFDAEYMRTLENRGKEIVIREGAKESVDIPVISR